ncbi:hypothetical protein V8E54_014610 [Elaphomyces granulatus]
MTTVCPARLLLLDANMLHANISVGQRVVAQIMREQDSRKRLQSHREESPHSMIGRHSQGRLGVTAQNREKAGGRDFRSDRVESMRRQDWKSHKETCTGNQKYICFLIHPLMSSSGPESRDMLMDCMEPLSIPSLTALNVSQERSRTELRMIAPSLHSQISVSVTAVLTYRSFSDFPVRYSTNSNSSTPSTKHGKSAICSTTRDFSHFKPIFSPTPVRDSVQ